MRSRRGSGLPSTVTRSRVVTLIAGDEIVPPLTATRPAAIQSSASRREHRPARAITLAMRFSSLRPCAKGASWKWRRRSFSPPPCEEEGEAGEWGAAEPCTPGPSLRPRKRGAGEEARCGMRSRLPLAGGVPDLRFMAIVQFDVILR